jgi:hypothetical protein
MEPRLLRIGTEPLFGIGQHAYLVQAPSGNVLWDCITLVDDAKLERVRALGGISAMAISHPHYYSSIVEWSAAFNDAPIFIHAGDRQWVTRPSPNIIFWEGKTKLLGEGLTLIHGGGHFEGSAMLHWAGGAEGRGCCWWATPFRSFMAAVTSVSCIVFRITFRCRLPKCNTWSKSSSLLPLIGSTAHGCKRNSTRSTPPDNFLARPRDLSWRMARRSDWLPAFPIKPKRFA